MIKKSDNFVEEHVGKLVFAVIGILSLWLLWTFVFSAPYSVEYNHQKCDPSEIDSAVKQSANVLAEKLSRDPESKPPPDDKTAEFAALFECSLKDIQNCPVILPTTVDSVQQDIARKYRLPDTIGVVTDVSVEHVRSVAHVPTEPLADKITYKNVPTELTDIDFVTVQGSFDTAALYDSFRQSFAGVMLKSQWHDEELAKPIFAAVELQRRQVFDETHPAEWEKVGPTKIDQFAKLAELPQKITELEYGDIDLKKAEFDKPEVQVNILQPEPYDFAVSDERWLPPVLHKQYTKLLKSELEKEQREEREKIKTEREKARTANMTRRQPLRQPLRQPERKKETPRSSIGREEEFMMKPGSERYKIIKKRDKTSDDIVREAKKLLINERTKLDKLKEPLVFWAHDDSAVPGKNYQYRIRLGVLNPIAGKKWFLEDQSHLADELVLWTAYSEPTETISILRMMYFFPIAGSVERKTAEIEVSKFYMGRWMSKDFTVGPGQLIGNVVESAPVIRDAYTEMYQLEGNLTETIDYTTEAVLLDVVPSSDFANLFQQRAYVDILYTENGRDIEHLAAKSRNWPAYFRKIFSDIKDGQDRQVQIVQNRRDPFGSGRDRPGGTGGRTIPGMEMPGIMPGMPGMPGMPEMYGPGKPGMPRMQPER